MLQELNIKNFALIKNTHIEFDEKLNIITGETGAGKSIILEALTMCLGKRGDKSYIRYGEEKCSIEAVFNSLNKNIIDELKENDIDVDENLIIYREISQNGKSICKINSRTVTTNLLKKISQKVLNIHGQNDYDYFFDQGNQLDIIDNYGNLLHIREEYEKEFEKYKTIKEQLSELNLNKTDHELTIETEILSHAVKEIQESNIKENTLSTLEEHLKILDNAERIKTSLETSLNNISSGDKNILSMLNNTIRNLNSINFCDNIIKEWEEKIESIYYELEDIAHNIKSYSENVEYDEEEISIINNKISDINKLYRKYGGSYETMIQEYEKYKNRLDIILNNNELKENLRNKLENQEKKLNEIANKLTNHRKKSATEFINEIKSELDSLAMYNTSIKIIFDSVEPNIKGKDKISILISFNKGEEEKLINKVASGGEISRFMLALKNIVAQKDSINTLVFDEIDTGVSGIAAENIGKKLKEISYNKQVLCITHLPQIASCADTHFLVKKEELENETYSRIHILSESEKEQEIAKMISGSTITEASIHNAKELLRNNKR